MGSACWWPTWAGEGQNLALAPGLPGGDKEKKKKKKRPDGSLSSTI